MKFIQVITFCLLMFDNKYRRMNTQRFVWVGIKRMEFAFMLVIKIFQNLETSTFKGLGVLKLSNGK